MDKLINHAGHQIHYTIDGNGPNVVLIHGFLESATMWKDFQTRHSNEFRFIAIDLPGHGASELISRIQSMDLMAKVVREVIVAEGIYKACFIGHSMGGYVSLSYAEKYPEMLDGLVLLHSQAAADDDEAKNNRDRTIRIVESDKITFINAFFPGLFSDFHSKRLANEIKQMQANASKMEKIAITAALKGMKSRQDHMRFISETTIPLLFIAGDQDSRIPVEKVKYQSSIAKNAELAVLQNVGHMGFLESPEILFPLLCRFLSNCFVRASYPDIIVPRKPLKRVTQLR